MGLFSKDIKTLEDLYTHGLQDIYYAENQILKSLPTMIEAASNAELKRGLEQHLKETEGQVTRLQEIFAVHGEEPSGTRCPAIDGILKEGDDLMGEVEDPEVLSVGIIAAAQAVEHYEMTRYGALIAWAQELGHASDAALLERTLREEKAADKKLTSLAEARINPKAAPARPQKAALRAKRAPAPRRSAAHGRKSIVKKAARKRR
jgi:ferritin-like metal-binding protein YciE